MKAGRERVGGRRQVECYRYQEGKASVRLIEKRLAGDPPMGKEKRSHVSMGGEWVVRGRSYSVEKLMGKIYVQPCPSSGLHHLKVQGWPHSWSPIIFSQYQVAMATSKRAQETEALDTES